MLRDDARGVLQQAGLKLAAAAAAVLLAAPLHAGAASMPANAPLPALPPAPFDIEQSKQSKLLFDPMAYSGRRVWGRCGCSMSVVARRCGLSRTPQPFSLTTTPLHPHAYTPLLPRCVAGGTRWQA